MKKKRSTSSAGGINKPVGKGRRRPSSAGSVSSRRGSASDSGASSGALWQVDIGETSVWTIVGTGKREILFGSTILLTNAPSNRPNPLQLLCSSCSFRQPARPSDGLLPNSLKTCHALPWCRKISSTRSCGGSTKIELLVVTGGAIETQSPCVENAHCLRRKLFQDGPSQRLLWL